MKNTSTLILALAPILLIVQISQAEPSAPRVYNVHESIEEFSNVLELQETMAALNIQKTALHGIPQEILYYTDSEDLSLADTAGNNTLIQQVAAQTAAEDSFGFFCTIDPLDAERVNQAKDCLNKGASGVKLYNGYTYSHILGVDDPRLSELYQTLSDAGAVLMLAINSGEYRGELENVLTLNPNLKVICPHYCLASQSLDRLTDLMARYPNLYVDTSFGKTSLARTGFQTMSENHDKFVTFFTTFQDRILFGTDTVVTTYEDKGTEYLTYLYKAYINSLSEEEFEFGMELSEDESVSEVYTGLNLPSTILRKVLWQNAANLLE